MNKKKDFDKIIKGRIEKITRLKEKARTAKQTDVFLKEPRYLYLLLEITRAINMRQDFNKLLELIIDSAITMTKAERGFLMLFNKDGVLEFTVMRNMDQKKLKSDELKISTTVVNHVLAKGQALFLDDIYKDKTFMISKSIEVLGLRMVMCAPLVGRESLLGVIYVDSHSEIKGFSKQAKSIFEIFASQASVAIENNSLYDANLRDALTGLYNYRYLRNRIEEEITRASMYKKGSISFILIDIDNLKSINDSYGHLFGNSILKKIAEAIKITVRKYDVPARYGDDEFAVLLPETSASDANTIAKSLQKEINILQFMTGRKVVKVNISIGISIFPIEMLVEGERMIIEADHALLVAKSKGGNQIAMFSMRKDEEKDELNFIGTSKAAIEVRKAISKLAKTDATILITGETGTGKELITKVLHRESIRSGKPFVVVNCGAIPDNLLESELFGYERGAFTGAYKQHKGKFEIAQGGTIFLDEIGELPLHLQVKILRAIEQKEVEHLGSEKPIKIDVRVVAATNKNLDDEMKKGTFRKDLFYRLSIATIEIPTLRERSEDIEALSSYYLEQINKRYRKKFMGFAPDVKEVMMHHTWPGNVRELIHRIERAVIMGTDEYLTSLDLGFTSSHIGQIHTLKQAKDKTEKECITGSLMRNQWKIGHSAKELGISRQALRVLIKKHNITNS
jgi:diguanylate cyclase (GGDEF)-like protein